MTAINAAAGAYGHTYIDWTDWITGTGTEGAPAGDGNADIYINADGIHPSTAGGSYVGDRLAHAITYPFGAGFVDGIVTSDGTPIQLGFQP